MPAAEDLIDAITAARGGVVPAQIRRIVLDAQAAPILQQRAWAVGMGFEPDPAQNPAARSAARRAGASIAAGASRSGKS